MNRDITIIFLNLVRPKLYLDGFSATGIRAIRASKEIGIKSVSAERSLNAYKILKENQIANNVDIESYNEPFESVVSKYKFDFIDVDPYGSIVPFVDIAIQNSPNRGYVAFTATDLSVLTGSLPSKTERRYESVMSNNSMRHEMGVRNLLGFIARRAASLDKGIFPQISFWHGHYYRVIVQVVNGAKRSEETRKNLGRFSLSQIDPLMEGDLFGPMWIGSLNCNSIFRSNNFPESVGEESIEFFKKLEFEDTSTFFLDVTESFSRRKIDLISMEDAIKIGERNGLKSHRTHFSTTGIKCDDINALLGLLLNEKHTGN